MAKINLGGHDYDTDITIDLQAIVDKIKAAANGEDIPGVKVFTLPKNAFKNEESPTEPTMSLTSIGIFVGVIILLFLPAKK